eukprot:CFRG2756T1
MVALISFSSKNCTGFLSLFKVLLIALFLNNVVSARSTASHRDKRQMDDMKSEVKILFEGRPDQYSIDSLTIKITSVLDGSSFNVLKIEAMGANTLLLVRMTAEATSRLKDTSKAKLKGLQVIKFAIISYTTQDINSEELNIAHSGDTNNHKSNFEVIIAWFKKYSSTIDAITNENLFQAECRKQSVVEFE